VDARAREERTSNILRMSVTLDRSKLSGWLNASAFCRVKGRHGKRVTCKLGGGVAGGVECARKRVGSIQVEGWAGAEPHVKNPVHARDFGRVETQRLVERVRVLPSPKGGMLRGRHAG